MELRTSTVCAVLVCALPSLALAQNSAKIYSAYRESIVFIEVDGHMYNGEIERTTGSGFVISADGHILTNNHVVFANHENYKQITVRVRLGSRRNVLREASIADRDPANDLALLQATLPDTPLVPLGQSNVSKIGEPVTVLGFPLNLDVYIAQGIISGHERPNRWYTDTALNPGHSGGPVFSALGHAIGIVTGGVTTADVGGTTVTVEGVKFFVPSDVFKQGIGKTFAVSAPGIDAAPALAGVLPTIKQTYTISAMKDDHPVWFGSHSEVYTRFFKASEGFKFRTVNVVPTSQNKLSELKYEIVGDAEDTAKVTFRLESGPVVDRWRGWLDATLVTEQVKK